MGKLGGFLEQQRVEAKKRAVAERVKDNKELYKPFSSDYIVEQAARCMDCGVAFCNYSCPIGNNCPEFNDAVYHGNIGLAYNVLSTTNNFPEFTGRVCPAPCEGGCVLGINDKSVTIKNAELYTIEQAFEGGLVVPDVPSIRTGKKVAIIGSGAAGLAAAVQLNRFGHTVTIFEKDEKPGGIMALGIPDYKIEPWVIARRIDIMEKSGIEFKCNVNVGVDITTEQLDDDYDAVVIATGSREARDLPVEGRELDGIHFAMDFLMQHNRKLAGEEFGEDSIDAKNKNVVVIGGGDTGADCVGTSLRQGAKNVYQIELLDKPSKERTLDNPWPYFPAILRNNTAHDEANELLELGDREDVREWNILTKKLTGENGKVKKYHAVKVKWDGRKMEEIPGSEFTLDADLVLLAIGFTQPEHEGLLDTLGVEYDARGNVAASEEDYITSKEKFFAAGDCRRGQSLIVWAIKEGRECAENVNEFLSK